MFFIQLKGLPKLTVQRLGAHRVIQIEFFFARFDKVFVTQDFDQTRIILIQIVQRQVDCFRSDFRFEAQANVPRFRMSDRHYKKRQIRTKEKK